MKIEELIVQHLYKNKEVTLQEIGTFKLASDVIFPKDEEKEFIMPQDAISFEYNIKAGADMDLINYIVQHTNKIKPLATSDLESYIMLSKQFLNIGKPLVIEGLGTILKAQQGQYEFMPASFITPKTAIENTPLKEKSEEEISFRSPEKTKTSRKGLPITLLYAGILLICIGIVCFAISKLFFKSDKNTSINKEALTLPNVMDTTKPLNDTVIKGTSPNPSVTFKVVIKEYPDYTEASKSYTKLTGFGHTLVLYTTDSVLFKIAMPFSLPLKDTALVKDSLRRYLFSGNPYIEF